MARLFTKREVIARFGEFVWHNCPQDRGRIIIDDEVWIQENIVRISEDVPIVKKIECHKLVVPAILMIFATILKERRAKYIDVDDWKKRGGCWVPRHMSWNPKRSLSRHSWGIPVDINVKDNPYGSKGKQHPDIIDIFEHFHYRWGGHFKRPYRDPMHFEPNKDWRPLTPVLSLK